MEKGKEFRVYVTGSLRELSEFINGGSVCSGDIVTVLYRGGEYILMYYA